MTRASQEPAFLAISPMGKIPVLVTPEGAVAETVAILGYLEDIAPNPALVAADAFGRARERQLINLVQLYVEMPVRALFPGVFLGGSNSEETCAQSLQILERAMGALRLLARPAPFLLGDRLSQADLYAFYCLDIAERVMGFVYGRSILRECGLELWARQMADRPSSAQVMAAFHRLLSEYLNDKKAAYRLDAAVHLSGTASAFVACQ
ncbi:Glutathione S-transferase [compost metagenome]